MTALSRDTIESLPMSIVARGDARSLATATRATPAPDGAISREEFAVAWDAFISQFPQGVVVHHTPHSVAAAGGFGRDELRRYLNREPTSFVADEP